MRPGRSEPAAVTSVPMKPLGSLRGPRPLGRRAAFTVLTVTTVVLMATASAPSPIYPLYRERWDFSVTTVTVVFAVYVVGLLGPAAPRCHERSPGTPSAAARRTPAGSGPYGDLLDGRRCPVPGDRTGGAGRRHRNRHQWADGRAGRLLPGETPAGRDHGDGGRHEWAPGRRRRGGGAAGPVGPPPRHRRLLRPHPGLPDPHGGNLAHPRDGGVAGRRPVSLRPRAGSPQDSRRRLLAAVPALVASWSVTGLFLALTPSVVTGVLHVTH